MNKVVFTRAYAAVDAEIERLKRLSTSRVHPCRTPHAPDSKWEKCRTL